MLDFGVIKCDLLYSQEVLFLMKMWNSCIILGHAAYNPNLNSKPNPNTYPNSMSTGMVAINNCTDNVS